jgi:hypothetical protein
MVLKMDATTKRERLLRHGGFDYSKKKNHHLPKWAMEGPLPPSVVVHFSSKANFELPTKKAPTTTKKIPPPLVPLQMTNIFGVLQSMLTKQFYAAIESPTPPLSLRLRCWRMISALLERIFGR